MASITTELTTIAESVYGRQIRGAIHDAIQKVNNELTSTTSSESSLSDTLESEVTRLEGAISDAKTEVEGDLADVRTELLGDISAEGTRLEGVISGVETDLSADITAASGTATAAQTEVEAIRTRADGVTETSAANAVKTQFQQARAAEKAVYQEIVDTSLWSPAYYRATNGTRGTSTVMLANYADTYLPESWGLLTADPTDTQNIGFRLMGYDSTGAFVGVYDPTTGGFESSLARSRQPVRVNLDEIRAAFPGYKFKICATGNSSDFTMTAAAYGDHLHIFDKVAAAQHPKAIDWGWTVGTIDNSGVVADSNSVQRSEYIPVGAGTKLYMNAAHNAMKVMAYDKNWAFVSAASMILPSSTTSGATEWMNRFTVRHDGYIRVLLRPASGNISNVDTLGALLSCVDYVEPAFKLTEKLRQYDWVPAALVSGVPTEVFPNTTFPDAQTVVALSTRSIHYSDNAICIKCDPAYYHITVAYFSAQGTLLRQTGTSTAGMTCIPKGMYYRLSINAVPVATVTAALVEAYDIFDLNSTLWYGSTSSVGTVAIFQRSNTLITPDIMYSGRGLTVRCSDSQYTVAWTWYDSADPYSGLKRAVDSSGASVVYIPAQSFFRLIVLWSGSGVVSVEDAEAQLVWEWAEDVDPGIAAAGSAFATAVDPGDVPSYYTSHMATKAAAINNLRTGSRVQFAFVTDYHINAYTDKGGQTGNSGKLLRYLAKHTAVDMCVDGGDVANGEGDWACEPPYIAQFGALERNGAAALRVPGMVTYFVAGNHEGGISGGVQYAQLITAGEAYTASGLSALRGHVAVDQRCPLQYFWDDKAHNIRYIVCGIGLSSNVGGESDRQAFQFLAAALRTAPANCGIVIFNHIILKHPYTTPEDRTVLLTNLADAYNARSANYTVEGDIGTNHVAYADTLSDFSGCTGTVLAIIGGHSHFDYSYSTTGGIPVIVTTTDCAGGAFALNNGTASSSPRTTGTTEEQAIDVFTIESSTGKIWATRIGAVVNDPAFTAGVGQRTWNV